LPYKFNYEELELSPINSGLAPFFLFNALTVSINIVKSGLLLAINWYTDFQFEEIKGGYFFQLLWFIGPITIVIYMYSYSSNPEDLARTVTGCIRLERQIIYL
jgi:hypothetical protein